MLCLQLVAKPLKTHQRGSAFRQHEKSIAYKKVFLDCRIPGVMANADPRVIWHVI